MGFALLIMIKMNGWSSKQLAIQNISFYVVYYKWDLKSIKKRLHTSSTAQGDGGSFKNRKPIGEVGCCESQMAKRSH